MRVHRNGAIRVAKSKRPAPETLSGPVYTFNAAQRDRAETIALEMAKGDKRLVLPQPDGSFTIRNNPHYVPGR